MITGIAVNIALLFFYKYFGFAITAVNQIFHKELTVSNLLLPLGISFFTFQQIMYIVNVYRKEIAFVSVTDYLAYILYFPKLIMGPLAEPRDIIDQLNEESRMHVNWANVASGVKIFSFGLFKKMILADTFSRAVGWGFEHLSEASAGDLFLVMLFYTFEIYFDFSGYTDMAVGVAGMMNIDLPMNFDSPYKAVSIRDFWKRWHISLTRFLTKYLYIPLGGSKKGTVRTYVNILLVFLISGLWHGANWTFLLWGILHGLLQVIERAFDKARGKLFAVVGWLYTFFFVNLLWLLFRSESIAQWFTMLKKMFKFQDMALSADLLDSFSLPEITFFSDALHLSKVFEAVRGLPMILFILAAFLICLVPENNYKTRTKRSAAGMILCAAAFIWGFLCLGGESVFVYFNF